MMGIKSLDPPPIQTHPLAPPCEGGEWLPKDIKIAAAHNEMLLLYTSAFIMLPSL